MVFSIMAFGLLCALAILAFLPAEGFCYVDPGSVSLLLQVAFASVIGVLLAFKARIKAFFVKGRGRAGDDDRD